MINEINLTGLKSSLKLCLFINKRLFLPKILDYEYYIL